MLRPNHIRFNFYIMLSSTIDSNVGFTLKNMVLSNAEIQTSIVDSENKVLLQIELQLVLTIRLAAGRTLLRCLLDNP